MYDEHPGTSSMLHTLMKTIKEMVDNPTLSEDVGSFVEGITYAAEVRDPLARGHGSRVAAYTLALASRYGLPAYQVNKAHSAALYHDIGKVDVPGKILAKTGPLSPEERYIVERHVVAGEQLCELVPSLRQYTSIIKHHHEYFNGLGYPDHLAGNEIPIEARIIAIADSYDCITTNRSFRLARTSEEALKALKAASNTQFDPTLVSVFCDLVAINFPFVEKDSPRSVWDMDYFFDASPIPCVISTLDSIILRANNALLSTLERNREDIIGKNFYEKIAPEYSLKTEDNGEISGTLLTPSGKKLKFFWKVSGSLREDAVYAMATKVEEVDD